MVALILNTNADRFRRQAPMITRVRALAGRHAAVWATRSLAELDDAARAIAALGPERVVLCGGDGTFMAGTTALYRAYGGRELPTLVLAPAGTAATVARGFGHRSGLIGSVRRAVDSVELCTDERATLAVAEADGSTRVGFIFGAGLVARFFDRYYLAGAGGYASAAKLVARIFGGSLINDRYASSVLEPQPCRLRVDGRLLAPGAWSLIVSSTIRDLGLGLRVTYRGGEDPERPHLVASPLGTRALGIQAPRVILGLPLGGADHFDGLVQRFEIEFLGNPGPYVLDGDMFKSTRIAVTAGPRIRVAAF